MAISHADHDHPNTPAARAACRKAAATTVNAGLVLGNPSNPPKMTVVPRTRGDGGVVKGLQATAPKTADKRLKVSGTMIRRTGDLADVPVELAAAIRQAWTWEWDVQVGDRFTDAERRIVITGVVGTVSLVWDHNGRTAVFVRSDSSSITHRVDSYEDGMTFAASADAWPWKADDGRLV